MEVAGSGNEQIAQTEGKKENMQTQLSHLQNARRSGQTKGKPQQPWMGIKNIEETLMEIRILYSMP